MLAKRSVNRNRISANANLYEQINPIKEVTLRAQQSMTAFENRISNVQQPSESFYTPMGDYVNFDDFDGFNQQTMSRYYSFTYTNTAEYRNTFNDVHNVTVLLGQEAIISKTNGFGVFSEGQPGGNLMAAPERYIRYNQRSHPDYFQDGDELLLCQCIL